MTQKEIRLGHSKYFILQYLRTMEEKFVTCVTLGKRLELSDKTVAHHLRDMAAMGIIDIIYPIPNNNHIREIKVKEEWLH